jgi:hypothetical protein
MRLIPPMFVANDEEAATTETNAAMSIIARIWLFQVHGIHLDIFTQYSPSLHLVLAFGAVIVSPGEINSKQVLRQLFSLFLHHHKSN